MPKEDRKNYLTSDLQVKTPSKNRRHPDSVPRLSTPLRKAYSGQAPHTVARQLRIFTEFPARSPIDFCSFIFDCFHFNPYDYHTVKGKSLFSPFFQSITLLLHRRKAPAKQGDRTHLCFAGAFLSVSLSCRVIG